MAVVALCDANVLYPSTLRDVLIRVGRAQLVRPKWSEQILDETFRNLQANRPDLSADRLQRTRVLMNGALRDVLVTGHEELINTLDLPDVDDRHVMAAAITGGARVIVTKNLRDFPASALVPYGLIAEHPDDFLVGLLQDHASVLAAIVDAIARAWKNGDTEIVLKSLAVEAPRTADLIRGGPSDF
ncbi:PIN domain-containing protein [Promicromonospora sp. Populi]|uniref:PIN domain-containing protein n=1 Tax=Promicromonospora sp. Populi TaxID=3239420 RepID=UPI0034E2F907